MLLPADFQFSQGSLQDYVACPRRFQLRYVERRRWPALEAEPALENERHLRQGTAFHRLIHQHLSGIPVRRLSRIATDPDLRRWWRNYLDSGPADLTTTRYPEVMLSAPMGQGRANESGVGRLVAKYDLVAVEPGKRAMIVDWKTNRKRPRRAWLAERLQTRVYPYLLVRAGATLNGGRRLQPEQVEMVYWFADFPAEPERFAYDLAQYEADGRYLSSLIEEIAKRGEDDFPLTSDEQHCHYCVYRSLCQRGIEAGPLDEMEEAPLLSEGLDFDFEQIAEAVY